MIPFPKIEQFRSAFTHVKKYATQQQVDAIVASCTTDTDTDHLDLDEIRAMAYKTVETTKVDMPVVEFTGTVKLHGTNGAICGYGSGGDIWCQSRKNILKGGADNAGFRVHVDTHRAHSL